MSDANQIVNAVLGIVTARDEDSRREAGEALETLMHSIACEHERASVAQDLPEGWTRGRDDYGPTFQSDNVKLEVDSPDKDCAYIELTGGYHYESIPVAVLRAFIAALDSAS